MKTNGRRMRTQTLICNRAPSSEVVQVLAEMSPPLARSSCKARPQSEGKAWFLRGRIPVAAGL